MSACEAPPPAKIEVVDETKTQVRVVVAAVEHAARIEALLEALGYRVVVEIDEDLADPEHGLRRLVARFERRYRLTNTDKIALESLLRGEDREQMAERLGVSISTANFHRRNLLARTGVDGEEGLLRLAAFGLDPLPRREPS